MAFVTADRNLLFGLLALQNGLIDQDQLVAAFRAWTRDKDRQIAEYLAERGDLDADQRSVIQAMVGLHEKKHGGGLEKSLAVIPAGRAACESLAALGDSEIEASLIHVGARFASSQPDTEPDRITTCSVTAEREPFVRQARRWARRNRTAVAALAALVLVALAGTAAVLAVQTRANADLKSLNLDLAIANDCVTQAKADLKSANDREKQRFNLALDAIKLFHGEVSDDPLMKEKPFEGLRTNLLKGAANSYVRLEGLLKGHADLESRVALGRVYDELGQLTEKMGDPAAALTVHRKSLAVRRALASEPGADAESKLDVARSLVAAGLLRLSTGDKAGLRESYEEARRLAEEAEAQGGAAEPARWVLGVAYHRLAQILSETGDPAGAQRPTRRRWPSGRSWPTPIPPSLSSRGTWRTATTASATSSATWATQPGRGRNTARPWRHCKLCQCQPERGGIPEIAGGQPHQYRRLRARDGDLSGARAAFGEALAIYQRLADASPTVTGYRYSLSICRSNLARSYCTNAARPTPSMASIAPSRLPSHSVGTIPRHLATQRPGVQPPRSGPIASRPGRSRGRRGRHPAHPGDLGRTPNAYSARLVWDRMLPLDPGSPRRPRRLGDFGRRGKRGGCRRDRSSQKGRWHGLPSL